MSFIRRKRGQVLLVHNERVAGTARVRQREVHRFASAAELEEALTPSGWARWTHSIAWREEGIAFDWKTIRGRLEEELQSWSDAPSGAKHRRNQKIERLASGLVAELGPLSLAKASDAEVIARVRPSLLALQASVSRLLPQETRQQTEKRRVEPAIRSVAEAVPMAEGDAIQLAAEEPFDEGMEHWWQGNRRAAVKLFRRALALDPQHADAHNHLGIVSLEARRLKEAELHFRSAMEGGLRHVEREGMEVHWGALENRPYLRALGNLALVRVAQKQWPEALAIHRQMLKLNPGDNQGVRFLIGTECLRIGDHAAALAAFESCMHEEVGCAFGLALARLHARGRSAEVGEALLTGFAANRYVAPMLLGDTWERLDAAHGTSTAEPEWAKDVIDAQAELWQAVPRGAELLRFWWAAPPVARWRSKLDEVMLALHEDAVFPGHSKLISEWSALRHEETIRQLARSVSQPS